AIQRLTVNAGMRYEYQHLPEAQAPNPSTVTIPNTNFTLNQVTSKLPSDKADFGPRAGAAYDLTGDGKTAIRGGYGLYYGRTINSTIYNALINTGVTGGISQSSVSIAPTTATAPIFPNTLASAPLGPGAAQFLHHDFKNAMIQ